MRTAAEVHDLLLYLIDERKMEMRFVIPDPNIDLMRKAVSLRDDVLLSVANLQLPVDLAVPMLEGSGWTGDVTMIVLAMVEDAHREPKPEGGHSEGL